MNMCAVLARPCCWLLMQFVGGCSNYFLQLLNALIFFSLSLSTSHLCLEALVVVLMPSAHYIKYNFSFDDRPFGITFFQRAINLKSWDVLYILKLRYSKLFE
jgi:hypothetical protein